MSMNRVKRDWLIPIRTFSFPACDWPKLLPRKPHGQSAPWSHTGPSLTPFPLNLTPKSVFISLYHQHLQQNPRWKSSKPTQYLTESFPQTGGDLDCYNLILLPHQLLWFIHMHTHINWTYLWIFLFHLQTTADHSHEIPEPIIRIIKLSTEKQKKSSLGNEANTGMMENTGNWPCGFPINENIFKWE